MRFVVVSAVALAGIGCGEGELFRPTPFESQTYDRAAVEESCDQLDNDHDGRVDEVCGCTMGDTQPCWTGPAHTRGRSQCRDGVQICDDHFEFPSWGECDGQVLPVFEQCHNGVDDDCNDLVDEGCGDDPCWEPEFAETPGCETCNGEDDDGDGQIDEDRVCGDGDEGDDGGPCPDGAYRICDAYCGIHQRCGPDGTWGPCVVDRFCQEVLECARHEDCPRGDWCDYGLCTAGTFSGEPCLHDEECLGYTCITEHGVCSFGCFHHDDCAPGLVCDLGACRRDSYQPSSCAPEGS